MDEEQKAFQRLLRFVLARYVCTVFSAVLILLTGVLYVRAARLLATSFTSGSLFVAHAAAAMTIVALCSALIIEVVEYLLVRTIRPAIGENTEALRRLRRASATGEDRTGRLLAAGQILVFSSFVALLGIRLLPVVLAPGSVRLGGCWFQGLVVAAVVIALARYIRALRYTYGNVLTWREQWTDLSGPSDGPGE